jgi:hypothetical protein
MNRGSRVRIVLVLAIVALFAAAKLSAGEDAAKDEKAELTAREIVRRADELTRGLESRAQITMEITRPRWRRTVTMETWTRGTEDSFIRILSPRKEKGVTFLKKGREAWQYIPAVDRTMKLPPSMMLQSWMGSDFTNDDVVRADSIVVDYQHKLVSEVEEDGTAYWVIEAVPKPEAPVVWGKLTMKIQKSNFIMRRADYADEDGELVKYYETSDIQTVEGRELAMSFVMHDVTRKGYKTSIKYDKLTFKPDIKKDTFSVRNLRK